MNGRYKRGWFGESHRHYLAAKGVKTNRYFRGKKSSSYMHDLREKTLADMEEKKANESIKKTGLQLSPEIEEMLKEFAEEQVDEEYYARKDVGPLSRGPLGEDKKLAVAEDFMHYKQKQLDELIKNTYNPQIKQALLKAKEMKQEKTREKYQEMKKQMENAGGMEQKKFAGVSLEDLGSRKMEAMLAGDEETAEEYDEAIMRRLEANKIAARVRKQFFASKLSKRALAELRKDYTDPDTGELREYEDEMVFPDEIRWRKDRLRQFPLPYTGRSECEKDEMRAHMLQRNLDKIKKWKKTGRKQPSDYIA